MKLRPLHEAFVGAMKRRLTGWAFSAKHRHFKALRGNAMWLLHIAFINHVEDFDATLNLSVEFKRHTKRVCIIGAELGNILGTGQRRYPVASVAQAEQAAESATRDIEDVGLPFLEANSDPHYVIRTLEAGGAKAMLISPLVAQHQSQIAALKAIEHAV